MLCDMKRYLKNNNSQINLVREQLDILHSDEMPTRYQLGECNLLAGHLRTLDVKTDCLDKLLTDLEKSVEDVYIYKND